MEFDYRRQLLDEISLEGLDGITLQALWTRLENNQNYKLGLTRQSKEFVWQVVTSVLNIDSIAVHFLPILYNYRWFLRYTRFSFTNYNMNEVILSSMTGLV